MKKQIFLFLTIIGFLACNNISEDTSSTQNDTSSCIVEKRITPTFQKVNATTFKEKLAVAKDPIILDVRTPQETMRGTISNATTMNFYDAGFQNQLKQLDKTKPVFVYCKSGVRSGQATNMMKTLGFQEVYDLIGGYDAYMRN